MGALIEELWKGSLSPKESKLFDTPEIKEILISIVDYRKELEKTLSEEQLALFNLIMEYRNDLEYLLEKQISDNAFLYGMQLTLETIEGKF